MLYEKFKPLLGDWGPKLEEFIRGPEMDGIYSKIKADSVAGKSIFPASVNTYRAFERCPFSSLRVVIIGQDPYPTKLNGEIIADGMAFSCSLTNRIQPSLDNLYEAIEDDCYNGMNLEYKKEQSLEYLAQQGVLLLNSALTVIEGKANSHQFIWKPFMKYLVENILNTYTIGAIFILMGAEAQKLEEYISPWHWTLKCEHPVAASYANRKMIHNNVFSKCNKILKDISGEDYQIKWLNNVKP